MLLPEVAAYVAGILDGEGTITMTRVHRNENRRLVVSIANTELPLLQYIREVVGAGKITSKKTMQSHHSPSFHYFLSCTQALALLAQVQPFLRSYKKLRAELALRHYRRLTPCNGRYTPALQAERQEFEKAMLDILPDGRTRPAHGVDDVSARLVSSVQQGVRMDKINRRDFIAVSTGALAAGGTIAATAAETSGASPGGSPAAAASPPPPNFSRRATPLRFNASIDDCEVVGKIPDDIDGAFYRVGYEWYYPPKFADDAILNADGYVSSFRIHGGKVDYRGRWVETHRLQQLRKAGRQLYGYYRNPYTDDPSIADPSRPNLRTVANTAPVVHGGKLFALKEDGLPHQIDPVTLETRGTWDFNGQYKSQTFTAHPKLDPVTGEMISFGYEATGLASDDLWIYIHDRSGNVKREVRIKVPYVSVIHDMAITQKYILIPFGGYVTSRERLLAGKVHWGWDSTRPSYIGVLPRDGEAKDMRWFKGPLRCMMHTFNAQDEKDGSITLHAAFWDSNFFPFFPNVDGSPFDPAGARAVIRKISINPRSRRDGYTEEILWPTVVGDLGKVDPQVTSLPTRYLYTSYGDPQRPFDRDRIGAGAPASTTNCYGRFDLGGGKVDSYFAGSTHSLSELSFVPRRGGSEGQGYLVGVADDLAERRSELVVVDAERMADGDVARVLLPFRLSPQVHGTWADASELPLG